MLRRPRHRRRAVWGVGRLLARRGRLRRRRRREEALPAGEDLRRRADATLGPPARRHGPRRRARPTTTASTACARSPSGASCTCRGPTTRTSGGYGYVVTRAELDALVARRAEKAGARLWQGAEAVAPLGSSSGAGRPGRRRRSVRRLRTARLSRGARPRRRRRRRRQLPLRASARDDARPIDPARDGAPRLLQLASPRRDLHRVAPRHPRPTRRVDPRLRLDLPARRRSGERRRSASCRAPSGGRSSTRRT